jgi:hypothetical protein
MELLLIFTNAHCASLASCAFLVDDVYGISIKMNTGTRLV